MKSILPFLLLILSTHVQAHPDMGLIRDLFSKASTSVEANNELYKITNSYSLTTFPIYYAYNAAAEMTLANHTYWPTSKLEYFNAGKERLEKAISNFPALVEIRYIRFCVQQGCPFFLNYSANLAEDKKYILKNIDQTDWTDSYKKEVIDFLNKQA